MIKPLWKILKTYVVACEVFSRNGVRSKHGVTDRLSLGLLLRLELNILLVFYKQDTHFLNASTSYNKCNTW